MHIHIFMRGTRWRYYFSIKTFEKIGKIENSQKRYDKDCHFYNLCIPSIHGQARGGGTGPQNTNWSQRLLSTKKKRRQAKKSKYEFVYELEIRNRSQIRIRIYILPSKYELVH